MIEMQLYQTKSLSITIKNESNIDEYVLNKIVFAFPIENQQQVILTSCRSKNSQNIIKYPITIKPNEETIINLICESKTLGYVKQNCLFCFEKFKIKRFFEFITIDPLQQKMNIKNSDEKRSKNNPEVPFNHQVYQSTCMVRGERPFRAPTFLPNRLPRAAIPNDLWDLLEDEEALVENYVHLNEILAKENYQNKFETLLHLEEMELMIKLSQVSKKNSCFID